MIHGDPLNKPVDIHDLLYTGLVGHPEDVALVCAKTHQTWVELQDGFDNLAGHYLALGLEPGVLVASLMRNSVELVIHYLA